MSFVFHLFETVLGITVGWRSLATLWVLSFIVTTIFPSILPLYFPSSSFTVAFCNVEPCLHPCETHSCMITLHLRQRTLYKKRATCCSSCWYVDCTLPPASLLPSEYFSHTPLCMVRNCAIPFYRVTSIQSLSVGVHVFCVYVVRKQLRFCWPFFDPYPSSSWKGLFHCSFILLKV